MDYFLLYKFWLIVNKLNFIVTSPVTPSKHRGKVLDDSITAEELYSTFTEIRNEYNKCAFQSKEKWKILRRCKIEDDNYDDNDDETNSSNKEEVEIAIMQHPSDKSCPYVRLSSTMPGNIEDVWDFLQLKSWDKTMPKMDPFYEGLTMIKTYRYKKNIFARSNNNVVVMEMARKRTKRLLTFGKRDFAFVSVSDVPMSENLWVSGTISIKSDKFLPKVKGYTRGYQDSIAFYESVPKASYDKFPKTKLTIIFRIDLNDSSCDDGEGVRGAIPMWLYVKTVGQTGLLSIMSMRRELKRIVFEKYSNSQHINENSTSIHVFRKEASKSTS